MTIFNILVSLLIIGVSIGSAFYYYIIYRKEHLILESLITEKNTLLKKNEDLLSEYEKLEQQNKDKIHKFLILNQISKNLASEKKERNLKQLTLEVLVNTNSIQRGIALTNNCGVIEVLSNINFENKIDDFVIDKRIDTSLWEYLKKKRVIEIKKLKNFGKIYKYFEDVHAGYFLTFLDNINGNEIDFIIVLGEKNQGEYGATEYDFLNTVAGQIDMILENARNNNYIEKKNIELTEKVYDLMTLNYASKMVASTLNIKDILNSSTDMFAEITRAIRGLIIYYEKESKKLVVHNVTGDYDMNIIGRSINVQDDELKMMFDLDPVTVLTNLKPEDENSIIDFYTKNREFFKGIKTELFIPLIAKNEFLGIILLGIKYPEEGYKDDNIELYTTLSSQIATSLYNAKLYQLAITDGMTKLYLHRYFQDTLEQELKEAREYDKKVSVLMTDIDHFKVFNDTYGHPVGDKVLIQVAQILKDSIRKIDTAARYGGEEFALILKDAEPGVAKNIAENIRKKVEKSGLEHNGEILTVTMSLGIYTFSKNKDKNTQRLEIVRMADEALYYSKERGRNRVTHFDDVKEHL